jgi:hypothetical protein
MFFTDRVYKDGIKERHTVYEYDDIVDSDKNPLFNTDKKWGKDSINYKSYLHKGVNKDIKSDYRVIKKKALVKKIVKMFFVMMIEDILNGDKVKIGTKHFFLYIGKRKITSPKYKFNAATQGINYIPYVKLPKTLTSGNPNNLMFMTLMDKYNKIFKRNLRSGKKYYND